MHFLHRQDHTTPVYMHIQIKRTTAEILHAHMICLNMQSGLFIVCFGIGWCYLYPVISLVLGHSYTIAPMPMKQPWQTWHYSDVKWAPRDLNSSASLLRVYANLTETWELVLNKGNPPVVSLHKGPVMRKVLPFRDVIMGKQIRYAWDLSVTHYSCTYWLRSIADKSHAYLISYILYWSVKHIYHGQVFSKTVAPFIYQHGST